MQVPPQIIDRSLAWIERPYLDAFARCEALQGAGTDADVQCPLARPQSANEKLETRLAWLNEATPSF